MVLGFDNFYAHPTSSFNEPVSDPGVEPDEGELVQVCFSLAWLPLVQGALSQLQLQSTWLGDPEAVLVAQGRATNLKGLFDNPSCPSEMIDTPYWDDDVDVDDEATPEEQTWYGEVDDPSVLPTSLTFRERAEIWTWTGLLALAASPGVAIAFVPLAERFVLAFKQANVGKIIRVFMDASEVASFEDDGSGDIIEIPVIGDPEAETHQLYITAGDS